ncbi:hypothetical protein N656DRAFT_162178 [Canariomyces notabilis]|uniref:Uncharacterized protein n=1 Tax=Canariomyces notabilis TaxID=2074819 RepID=A0AAN6TBQ4_9PEZI|nr:hypothetical protein N656DRAFT_162178 [Canariomyces arenarius]
MNEMGRRFCTVLSHNNEPLPYSEPDGGRQYAVFHLRVDALPTYVDEGTAGKALSLATRGLWNSSAGTASTDATLKSMTGPETSPAPLSTFSKPQINTTASGRKPTSKYISIAMGFNPCLANTCPVRERGQKSERTLPQFIVSMVLLQSQKSICWLQTRCRPHKALPPRVPWKLSAVSLPGGIPMGLS